MSKYRKSVFIVIYSKNEEGKIEYLVLKRKLHWRGWEFPKGGLEEGEKIDNTVKREIKEETGLDVKSIKKFDVHGKYKYKRKFPDRPGFIGQSYSLCAAKVNKNKVKVDNREHSDYKWLGFEDAIKRLTFPNQKECLRKVNNWLIRKNFRKMTTKNGTLMLAGRNEESNEQLINQAEKNEELFHTASPGSPFVNIKGKPKKGDIKDAARFCAEYSREGKKNKNSIEVHRFKKKDVYKGENMKKGTFGVKKYDKINVDKQDIEDFE